MKVCVTGSEGFLGQHLVRSLKKTGHQIIPFDLAFGSDILNQDAVNEAVEKSDAVIHLAAVADLNHFASDTSLGYKINVEGTRCVMKACVAYKVPFFFASTCCCYGNNECHPSNEESPLCPVEPYAASKKISEEEIQAYKGLDYSIIRLATFYGPGMRPALAVYIILDRIAHGIPVTIHGTGKQTRTFTHIDDIVEGIMCIFKGKMEDGKDVKIVNCTTTESVSVLDVVAASERVTGRKADLVFGEDRKGQIFTELFTNDRLTSLGFKLKYSFEEGLKDTYEWYTTK